MIVKEVILFIVGLLTVVIGITMVKDSTSSTDQFQNSMSKLRGASPNDWTTATNIFNAKRNSLSMYGILSIVYGAIVVILSAYSIFVERDQINVKMSAMIMVGVLAIVGIILIANKINANRDLKKIKVPPMPR